MRIAIIGRSELLFETAKKIAEAGFEIALVVTAKEAPEYRIKALDFEDFAKKHSAKFIYTSKINEEAIYNEIVNLPKIDLAVSINYSGIISQNIIDLFPLGILNAHGGDLPRYRGNACQAWAILNKETKIGMCVHKMIGGELDNGDIIARDYLNIDINTKIGIAYKWMENIIPPLMLTAIKKLNENSSYVLESQSKDPKDALRCYPRLPEDGRICWDKNNEEILRLINASSEPFAGAYCFFEDKKMIIWDAELVHEFENFVGVPGQVSAINKTTGAIETLTNGGKIRIKEIEYENIRTTPSEFIKSLRKRLS